MQILLLFICSIYFIVFSFSCDHKKEGTLEYSRLQYDTSNIAIFNWDTSQYQFPINSDPLPLFQEDLAVVDSILKAAVDSINKNVSVHWYEFLNKQVPLKILTIDLKRYKRQYLPYHDVNGQRIIYVNCFCKEFANWRNTVYIGKQHSGLSRFDMKVNLEERGYYDLMISPVGDMCSYF